jgi:hypothetical protein
VSPYGFQNVQGEFSTDDQAAAPSAPNALHVGIANGAQQNTLVAQLPTTSTVALVRFTMKVRPVEIGPSQVRFAEIAIVSATGGETQLLIEAQPSGPKFATVFILFSGSQTGFLVPWNEWSGQTGLEIAIGNDQAVRPIVSGKAGDAVMISGPKVNPAAIRVTLGLSTSGAAHDYKLGPSIAEFDDVSVEME